MPPKTKTQEKDNRYPLISPLSVGMEDLNSGRPICKLRLHSRLMKDTFKPSQFLPMMENMLPPEEEIENSISGMSPTYLPHPENSTPRLRSTKSPSTLNSNGLPLPPNPESRSGTLSLLTLTLFTLYSLT